MLNLYRTLRAAAFVMALPLTSLAQGVGIGTTTPDASAALDIVSTTKGLLLPRLTLAQRTALTASTTAPPVAGLVIYQTDNTPGLYAYDGTTWVRLGPDNLGNHTATQFLVLADYDLRLRTAGDPNHGLGWYGTSTSTGTKPWLGQNIDGPVLYGNLGGVLGTKMGGARSVLNWTNDGNVGIGTSTPSANLHVAGSMKIDAANPLEFGAGVSGKQTDAGKIGYQVFSADALDIVGAGTTNANRKIRFFAEGGAIFNGSVTGVGAYNSSDQRLKQDIRPLTNALALVQRLHGRRYQWNALGVQRGGQAHAEQVGVLAQELEQVLPELVHTGTDGYKAVNYAQLTPVLIEAIKEQQQQMEVLKAQLAAQAGDQATLETLKARAASAEAKAAQATATTEAFEARLRRLEADSAQAQR